MNSHSIRLEQRVGRRASASPVQTPRVLLAGKLTALSAPGGGEVQMLELVRALAGLDLRASLWRPWEQPLDEADVLHLFGSLPEHVEVARAARRRGVKVVLSPITWFDHASLWREPWSWGRRAWASGKLALRGWWPRCPGWRRQLYETCDLLLPNSNAEARQLERFFGVPSERLSVVPNGADPRFALGDPATFSERFGVRDFVLCAGRIEPRKNQRRVIEALRGSGLELVILGDPVPGHEAYAAACRQAADERVHFIPRLSHGDPALAGAYAACRCLVLASWYETPGLVALEAAMSGVPLVLPRGGSAREYFGPLAEYVGPDDRREIAAAVARAVERGCQPELAALAGNSYTWQAAAEFTREAYDRVLA